MKRVLAVILVLLLTGFCGISEANKTDNAVLYELGLQSLYDWTLERYQPLEEANKLFADVGTAYKLGRLYKLYTDALLLIVKSTEGEDMLQDADDLLWLIGQHEGFVEDLKERELISCEDLSAYIQARSLEQQGQIDEALKAYGKLYILDSVERQVKILKTQENRNLQRYQDAQRLFSEGNYEAAQEMFSELAGYGVKDSASYLQKCIEKVHTHSWREATCTEPKTCSTCGATEGNPVGHDWQEATYEAPKTCARCGLKVGEALKRGTESGKDNLSTKSITLSTGDLVSFGHYEQDGNKDNGEEPIQWIVLKVESGNATLISRYAIAARAYSDDGKSVTWETSAARAWLNNGFISDAFDKDESELLLTVKVNADKNSGYDINPGASTSDKVYLLSLKEARSYFGKDEQRICLITEMVRSENAARYGKSVALWWYLRTPGRSSKDVACVNADGSLNYPGKEANPYPGGLRPCITVSVKQNEKSFTHLLTGSFWTSEEYKNDIKMAKQSSGNTTSQSSGGQGTGYSGWVSVPDDDSSGQGTGNSGWHTPEDGQSLFD